MKRIFDFLLSLLLFILFSPIILITFVLIRIKLGTPTLFKQTRIGLNERIFTIYKFRTMNNVKNAQGILLSDADRLTPFGQCLRKTSLDKLPQLWNVLKGDMSLVGPRPLFPEYLPLYTAEQKRRHLVRPGITGWAQINGRNNLQWDKKFKLDLHYVDNCTFYFDMKILLLTALVIVKQRGINFDEKTAQVSFFKGSTE